MLSATSLHASPIFGPVQSRRLGVSLGINLMPGDGKMCSFDCIYCECGTNGERSTHSPRPSRDEVVGSLERVLQQRRAAGQPLHTLTFSGNGEPTLHPDFPAIIDDVLALRHRYFPEAKVSVLSNATTVHRPEVREALMKVDNNIQKLDTVSDEYIRLVDRPAPGYSVERVIRHLSGFAGHVIVQSLFMTGRLVLQWSGTERAQSLGHRGEFPEVSATFPEVSRNSAALFEGSAEVSGDSAALSNVSIDVDNTSDAYVLPWLQALERIRPQGVMVYTVSRPTPFGTLAKAPAESLDSIAQRVRHLGIPCSVSY